MKLRYPISYLNFLLICLLYFPAYSQVPGPEILTANRESLTNMHEQNFGDLKDVISGREHRAVYHFTNGHPFWKQQSWLLGNVKTNIHYYPGLTVRYDLYRDVLIYLPDSLSIDFFAINQDQVQNFTLDGTPFLNLGLGDEMMAMKTADMKPGYYEWVYQGATQLFAKNWKELKGKSGDANAHSEFYDRRNLYVYVDESFVLVKKKKHLLNALQKHKSEIRSFIRKNHLNIRNITDTQFINLLRHYDSL